MDLIIYCDESAKKGNYFGNFYGGALVKSSDFDTINEAIVAKKNELNLFAEIKWYKVTAQYLDKYISLMDTFFNFIQEGKVKIRIMFTQNYIQAINLTKEQREKEFFILYYQFIKHAFGLKYCDIEEHTNVRIYFDKLPDTKAKCEEFKDFIYNLQDTHFYDINLHIKKENITEVDSHEHPILQCMDVILGSMNFRLNNSHLEKPEGSRKRGKKTIAKETLYKYINHRIRQIYSNFNIGISTGWQGEIKNLWHHQYRHWRFRPNDFEIDPSKGKRHK